MNIKALGKIRHNGKSYKPGDIVPDLTEEEYDRLIRLGDGEPLEGQSVNPPGLAVGGQLPLVGLVLSVEQFADLKADEQKAHLKALEIDPAGKEEERIVQYEEWYASQLPEDELNVQL
ncbi:hypothetical protein NYE69_28385 [Paenibacillus sp. FSL R5-0527]|uniref:DUF7210 family protein n=1 Tax=Paenibacillus sp. FSL R5-0527 TaxID=2975321 RepID=UPI00097AE5D7|nr:hypothetical protein [Paenibacillus macerans]OMG49397.1 hypothetical protein BK140_11020 [Paenibacillus macerans]